MTPEQAEECPKCNLRGDHTWWCMVGATDGTRNYYWRD